MSDEERERARDLWIDLRDCPSPIEVIAAAFAAVRAETVEKCAKVLEDELRLRPVSWGAQFGEYTPLHRLAREIRALAKEASRG